MFELILLASTTSEDGDNLIITDGSDWALADFPRTDFGVFVTVSYQVDETPAEIVPATYDPLDAALWTIPTLKDGRYSLTAYAFLEKDTEVPAEGDVHIDTTDGLLYQWVSAAWILISLEDAIAAEKAYYTSEVLEIPFLSHAYGFRNYLNLEYIKQVKSDIQHGAQQNKLYYKRTDLDYFYALILGAEYNWSIGLYSNYYEIVSNLADIISSKQLS